MTSRRFISADGDRTVTVEIDADRWVHISVVEHGEEHREDLYLTEGELTWIGRILDTPTSGR